MRQAFFFLLLSAAPVWADAPVVDHAEARVSGETWTISVTLSHGDTGWDDYADGWQVLAPDGRVLGTRILHHPHVEEQPFTRSLSGVAIPEGITEVQIQARDNQGGWAPPSYRLTLPMR
jgi:hypothetical protein